MPVLILYTFSLKHLSIKGKWFPKEPEKIKDAEEMSQYFADLYSVFTCFKSLPFLFSLTGD